MLRTYQNFLLMQNTFKFSYPEALSSSLLVILLQTGCASFEEKKKIVKELPTVYFSETILRSNKDSLLFFPENSE